MDCYMSQTELAKCIGFASATAVSLLEADKRKVSVTLLKKIAQVTGKQIGFFFQEGIGGERLYPLYKRVKVMMPHCPICRDELSGNNSIDRPWKCSCGTWKVVFGKGYLPNGYEITPTP